MTSDDDAHPRWRSYVRPWLDSEYLDGRNSLRFRPGYPGFSGSNWPLGFDYGPDVKLPFRWKSEIFDFSFDNDVNCAFRLPWQMSKLRVDMPECRFGANLSIRNIGHWSGDAARYDFLVDPLRHNLKEHAMGSYSNAYALTPFCIISQQWSTIAPQWNEQIRKSFPPQIAQTNILLFYTFETFIQECLALGSYRLAHGVDAIVENYRHVYTNARPVNLILSDPALLPLSSLANPSVDWDTIWISAATAGGQPPIGDGPQGNLRAWRDTLFKLRLQAHLMVAITVALRGVAEFAEGRAASALVKPVSEIPRPDQLTPFWLGHVLGAYDHAIECENLLASLAEQDGKTVDPKTIGQSFRSSKGGTTLAEESIRFAWIPGFDRRHGPPSDDFFRWWLFESTLDDRSMEDWIQKMGQLELGRYGG